MTERLYYTDSFLSEFDAGVMGVREFDGRRALVLDRSAFYPTSGGQVFDTGSLVFEDGTRLKVVEVIEDENGEVLHVVESGEQQIPRFARDDKPVVVHGAINVARRRDHMQQHTGQHVLSAALVELFAFQTVSFHMGDESCTIDLDTKNVTDAQVRQAEELVNRVVMEDRPVTIRFATVDEARTMGVRKIPPDVAGELRLIDIDGFDLNACGGTHVSRTGQIGPILLRKTEKVKQGVRVEFVCGERAVRTARTDFAALTEAAAVFSTHIWEVAQQARKTLEEIKAAQRERKRLLEELAEREAEKLLRETPMQDGQRLVTRVVADRDLAFIKLVAQKLAASSPVVALLGCGGAQPALVFAQSSGGAHDMSALMKEAMAAAGGRGGGTRDMAQGGAPAGSDLEGAIRTAAERVRS
ncbi:MAG: alanyl-tRNA editing protein [Terriglobales bacterium]